MNETLICDFCSGKPIYAEYPAQSFVCTDLPIAASKGGWTACLTCHHLIQRDDWPGLAARATDTFLAKHPEAKALGTRDDIIMYMQRLHAKFREFRLGPPRILMASD